MNRTLDVLVLAAGRGTRMKSSLPKVLHPLGNKPLIEHVLGEVEKLNFKNLFVVVGYGQSEVRKALSKWNQRISFVRQPNPRGTGHAVFAAKDAIHGKSGDLLVLAGDAPFLSSLTLTNFIRRHRQSGSKASILSAKVRDPRGYGRIVRDLRGEVACIREELDGSRKEREIQEVNSGAYVFDKASLFDALSQIKTSNKKGEYYLTDTVEVLIRKSCKVSAFCLAGEEDVMGINTRQDLVKANLALNRKKIGKLLDAGVTVLSTENTFVASDVRVGRDTVIYPFTYIEQGVKIGKGCRIGPFAYLREGSCIEDKAQIGSFVEVVRSRVGKGTLVKHLSYVGDSRIGNQVNIGAGTITANYDGFKKHKTVIGDGAFIGSNTVLVAPIRIGKKARTGAGAVVLAQRNVPGGQTVAGVPARRIGKNYAK